MAKNWWEILRVSEVADPESLKKAYQNLVKQVEDDEALVKLLNWAYEAGKQAHGIYEWEDVISGIDQELERLQWSQQKGKQYLLDTYGKGSRLLLTDSEILQFWETLKRQEDP